MAAEILIFYRSFLTGFILQIGIRWLFFLVIKKSKLLERCGTVKMNHWSFLQSRIALVFLRMFDTVITASTMVLPSLLTIFWFDKCGIWRGSLLGNEHSNLPIYFGFEAEFLIQSKVIFGRFFLIRSISVNETSISGSQPGQGISI